MELFGWSNQSKSSKSGEPIEEDEFRYVTSHLNCCKTSKAYNETDLEVGNLLDDSDHKVYTDQYFCKFKLNNRK